MKTITTDLESIQAGIQSLQENTGGRSPEESLRQLEVLQGQTVQRYLRAARDGQLPKWISLPEDDPTDALLPVWEALARSLEVEFPGSLPQVDSISDYRIPLIAEARGLHIAPVERVSAWLDHASKLVGLLVAESKIERPLSDTQQAVFDMLAEAHPEGLQCAAILMALKTKGGGVGENHLYKNIMPALVRLRGIVNVAGKGYCLPPESR